ncbi:hypothetical protein [Sulfurovum sp.]|uniref:hypothetical protein n=1 Tax=Sulfurovum sp. TaxID=1969726 RepID=UPI00356A515E
MKTVIAWVEYTAPNMPSICTCEYATYGKDPTDYPTVKEFLDALKNLGRTTGYHLEIKNVVTG